MEQLNQTWMMLKLGGWIILPLSLLGIIALAFCPPFSQLIALD